MTLDSKITKDGVLKTIYATKNRGRKIWSACTTLEAMGIEWYPHQPNANRLAMKEILKELCEDGKLIKRPNKHSHFTFKETAYERIP